MVSTARPHEQPAGHAITAQSHECRAEIPIVRAAAQRAVWCVDKAYDRVRGLITDRKPVLLSAAAELKAKETLEGDRLRRLLAGDPAEETR